MLAAMSMQARGAAGAGGHLEAELLGRVLPVPGSDPVPVGLGRLQLLLTVAGELRDHHDLQVMRVRLHPPRRRGRPQQLPLAQLAEVRDGLPQQRGQPLPGRRRPDRPVAGERVPRRHRLGSVARGLRHGAPPPPWRVFFYMPR